MILSENGTTSFPNLMQITLGCVSGRKGRKQNKKDEEVGTSAQDKTGM